MFGEFVEKLRISLCCHRFVSSRCYPLFIVVVPAITRLSLFYNTSKKQPSVFLSACIIFFFMVVRTIVVAVQQPLERYLYRVYCITPPSPCVMTIHKTCTNQQWNDNKDSACFHKINVQCAGNTL